MTLEGFPKLLFTPQQCGLGLLQCAAWLWCDQSQISRYHLTPTFAITGSEVTIIKHTWWSLYLFEFYSLGLVTDPPLALIINVWNLGSVPATLAMVSSHQMRPVETGASRRGHWMWCFPQIAGISTWWADPALTDNMLTITTSPQQSVMSDYACREISAALYA